jgi:hypothetical protein
MITEL